MSAGADPLINDVAGLGDAAFRYTTFDWQTSLQPVRGWWWGAPA